MSYVSPEREYLDRIEANKQKWTRIVAKHLVGATITNVAYLTEKDCRKLDWYSAPAVLQLMGKDGIAFEMFAMQDDEGNDGGALGTTLEKLQIIPVI